MTTRRPFRIPLGTFPLTFPVIRLRKGQAVSFKTMFGQWRAGEYVSVCREDRRLAYVKLSNGTGLVPRKEIWELREIY